MNDRYSKGYKKACKRYYRKRELEQLRIQLELEKNGLVINPQDRLSYKILELLKVIAVIIIIATLIVMTIR